MKRKLLAPLLVLCLTMFCACTVGQTPAESSAQPQTPTPPAQSAVSSSRQPASAPSAPEPSYTEAYEAYLNVLGNNRADILNYNWQMGLIYDEERFEMVPMGDSRSIAVADVWGDETPELIYLSAPRYGDYAPMDAELHVVTCKNGRIQELYRDNSYDTMAGAGMCYRLYQLEGDKGLCIYTDRYTDVMTSRYLQLSSDGSVDKLAPVHDYSYYFWYEYEDDVVENTEWEIDGDPCTQDEYLAVIPSEEELLSGLLLSNTDSENEGFEPAEGAAMTCEEAVAYLRKKAGVETDMTVDETAFFSSLPDFWFASGAGGWQTTLSVEPDGSFTGSFYDSDMGVTGDGYPNGTVYVCEFSGRFGNVVRLDDYTYVMDTLELTSEPTEADEWIEDGILYVSSYPYGMEDAEKVCVYLPGAQMSKLPWDFVSWVSAPHVWGADNRPSILPFCGLYNENAGAGFSGDE